MLRVLIVEAQSNEGALLAALLNGYLNHGDSVSPVVAVEGINASPAAPAISPALLPHAEAPRKAAVVHHKAKAVERENVAVVAPAAAAPVSGCRAEVFALLKAAPKTSKELIDAVAAKYTPASVYLALKELRGGKLVETRDCDGENKNVRVA